VRYIKDGYLQTSGEGHAKAQSIKPVSEFMNALIWGQSSYEIIQRSKTASDCACPSLSAQPHPYP
jgi:hypothetical protein